MRPKQTSTSGSSRLFGRSPEFIAAFLAGVACTAFFQIASQAHDAATLRRIASTAFTPANVTGGHAEDVPPPLGLQWFQNSYRDRWAASINYTGNGALIAAYDRVLKDRGALPRVVVSFTSLPKRLAKHAREMLRILKRQTYLPDQIYANIPKSSRRSNDSFSIPSWLTDDPLVTVLRPEVDMGPATKLIPTLHAEAKLGNFDTRIITVDDDNEGRWRETSLLEIFAYSLLYENDAIGLTGWNVTCMLSDARCGTKDSGVPVRQLANQHYNFIKASDDYACHSLADWLPDYYANCLGAVRKNYIAAADVLEGYKGVLYQPRFFDLKQLDSLLDKSRTPAYFFLCDDVWFSGWLSVRGVRRIVVNPAIHEDSHISRKLVEYSKTRNLSAVILPESADDQRMEKKYAGAEVEKGLHSLTEDFVKSNHDGVKWFQKKNGWVRNLWVRPPGYIYPSEKQ